MSGRVVSGRGRTEVELEFPDPARVVLLTAETVPRKWITLRERDGVWTPGHPNIHGYGRAAVPLSPERQRAMRRITVDASERWTVTVHDPGDTVALATGAKGSGPRLLEYRGGAARAVVTQTHDTAGALRVVHYPDGPDEPPVVVADTFDFVLSTRNRNGFALDGPQFVVVEHGQDWSFTVESADLPRSTALVRNGFGNSTELFDRPDPGRPAVLEMALASGSCGVDVLDENGRFLTSHRVRGAESPASVPLWGGRKDAALGRLGLRVEDCDSTWRMTLRPDRPERRLVDRAEGDGGELLCYQGPPAVLQVRRPVEKDRWLGVEAPGGRVSGLHAEEWCGALLIGAAPYPEVISVEATGGWVLEVTPLDGVRTVSGRLTGRGSEVVRWTGDRRRIAVRNRPRHRSRSWRGIRLGAAVWSADGPRDAATAYPDAPARDVAPLPGCLLLVHDPYHAGWRLTAR
ncbi:hypothetical protein [Kitasatospora purpeofusca]|uniref:hypothetical protein n=1 Tax=Kitasatospora purpeofusca TaxID=67352 RepID=UPI0036D289BE